MKLKSATYTSPIPTEGTFENVFIEETAIQLKRQENYLRIDFEMYYQKNNQKIVLCENYIAFQGLNSSENSTNVKATFRFNGDSESQEPRGLINYLIENNGEYPTDYYMVSWGYPNFEDALTYLSGGSFQSPEIQPLNDFVRDWILNSVVMKGEAIGQQFQFVQ